MHIDTRQFPLVWMSSSEPSNWESELNALLCQHERFVLLTRERPDREHGPRGEDRKRFALWVKHNRESLKHVCAGSILIVSSEAIALPLRVIVVPLGKAFGYPIRVATEDQLDVEIDRLLNRF